MIESIHRAFMFVFIPLIRPNEIATLDIIGHKLLQIFSPWNCYKSTFSHDTDYPVESILKYTNRSTPVLASLSTKESEAPKLTNSRVISKLKDMKCTVVYYMSWPQKYHPCLLQLCSTVYRTYLKTLQAAHIRAVFPLLSTSSTLYYNNKTYSVTMWYWCKVSMHSAGSDVKTLQKLWDFSSRKLHSKSVMMVVRPVNGLMG